MTLALSPDLKLPIEAATQTFLIVGKRGSGKSNTAVRMAEQLYHAGVPWVALDPVDTWWGVKSSRDGKSAGLNVYVFGGPHGDLPLEPTAGALIADTLVDHRISAVLAVKHFSGRERTRFVTDFASRLFQRNKEPLHVFLEEAHETAPQNPYAGEEEMLGAVTRLSKLGRASGLGVSAITQRAASLSKNITTQAEILVVHRLLGPQDVAAVKEWIKYHGEREEILGQLSTLKTGEAFVWAPDFPEGRPIGLKRVMLHQRETFDSAATPKAGEKRVEPKALAAVDLDKLSVKMAATIEKAKADDPRALRAEIARLQGEVRKASSNRASPVAATPKTIEKRVLKDQDHRRLEVVIKDARHHAEKAERAAGMIREYVDHAGKVAGQLTATSTSFKERAAALETMVRDALAPPAPTVTHPVTPPQPLGRPVTRNVTHGNVKPGGTVEQRILDALGELEQLGAQRPERELVAFLAGYSNLSSKGFVNATSALRTQGLIDYPDPGTCALTEAGRARAQPPARPRTAQELQARVIAMLGGASGRILAPLIAAYPEPMKRVAVAAQAGYGNLASKGFVNAISRLRTLGFVEYPDSGSIVAMPVLFLEGGR